jgi:Glycosyl hydrolases family 16
MSRRALDAASEVEGYALNSKRGRRKATISRSRRLAASLTGSVAAVVVVLACVGAAASQAEPMPVGVPGTWALRLNEEFTAGSLNTALWTPGWQHGGISGPMSGQCLSSGNVSQPGNGYVYLQVKAQHNTCGTTTVEDTGGLIESNPSDGQPGHSGFAYTYGVVEWRAYVPGVAPTGRGCPKGGCLPDWPALWSLSSTNADEIDIMEGLGTLGQACYHIHPPPGSEGPGGCLSGSYAGAWHTYAAKWEPGYVQYFYDGAQIGQVSSEVLNGTPQYLIADMVPPGLGQPLVVPDEMVVDYVRVWQHPVPTSGESGSSSWVVRDPTTGYHYVYWHGSDGALWTTTYGTKWNAPERLGQLMAAGTSPTVVENPATGYQYVYFQGTDGGLWTASWNGSWATTGLGGHMAAGTSPAVVRDPSTGYQYVYWKGSDHALWTTSYGPNWNPAASLGGSLE